MSVWIALLVPFLLGLLLILFFKHKVVWWEFSIPFAFTIIYILIAKWIAVESLILDTEYLGGYVTQVNYYEDWNEYIHRTCTSCSGSGKTRSCHTYDCSYVQYHPEYWEAETTLGTFGISHQRYDELAKKFKVTPVFLDLHRHYHTNDGDMYLAQWRGDDEGLEPVTVSEHYENKPQASLNLFHFDPVDSTEKRLYNPVAYPDIYNVFHQECLIGIYDEQAHKSLQILNARLGHQKEVRVYIIVFIDKPREAGFVQERFWQGGNKNELVICIGVDKARSVKWVYDFSWTDKQNVKIDIRTFVEQQNQLDLEAIVIYINNEVVREWKRKNFHDFDYLNIEPTTGQVIFIVILALIVNGLIGWWIVENDFEHESDEEPKWRNRSYRFS